MLNNIECAEWLTQRGIDFQQSSRATGHEGYVSLPATGFRRVFEVPAEASAQIQIADVLAKLPKGSEVMLWVTSWSVSTEAQRMIFNNFRESYGEYRWLMEAPGHLLNLSIAEDRWKLTEILLLLMAFNWEGFVIQGNQDSIIWMADEIVEVRTHTAVEDELIHCMVDELLPEISEHEQ